MLYAQCNLKESYQTLWNIHLGVLNIYMENPEIPVGKSNGTHHSIWNTSEIMELLVKVMHFYYSFWDLQLIFLHFACYRIYAKNFHPGGLRKWLTFYVLEII